MPKIKKNEEDLETIKTLDELQVIDESAKCKSTFKRDELGLLDGKSYEFTEDGLVNWRKMIDTKYLVPNLSKFPSGTENKNLNVQDLEDSQLLILLGGIKDLANIRGYSKVQYNI